MCKNLFKAEDLFIFIFPSLLVFIFSSNIGIVFLVRIVTNMLKLYVQEKEITNGVMLKTILFAVTFSYFHMLQETAFILFFILKMLLACMCINLK